MFRIATPITSNLNMQEEVVEVAHMVAIHHPKTGRIGKTKIRKIKPTKIM